jgi:putative transposase
LFLTFRHGLHPTRSQHRVLERILEGQRLLYNAALEERIQAWRKARKSISRIDQFRSLTEVRADDPQGYGALPANVSRWSLRKVDEAFRAFFRRVKAKNGNAGFPRFRSMRRWRSFGFSEFSGIRVVDGALAFKGMPGRLRLHMHRPLPEGVTIKSCVFTKTGRTWTVCLQVEIPEMHTVRREAGDLVGIDWGVESLATLSTGETVENPRFGREAQADIRRVSRKLARAKRGSKRRLKSVARLARLRRRLADRRKTHLHQVSANLAKRFGAIAVEQLQVANMTASAKGTADRPGRNVRQKAGLNREILDTAPGMMIAMLRYKAERAGSWFAVVDARNTSQQCSGCGHMVPKDLSVRVHRCTQCETEVHRDVNAARNILKRAVAGPWNGFAQQDNVLVGGCRSGNLIAKIAA